MVFKRHVDRLPIPPKNAQVQNVVCQFCIVGCGYKAYTWDIDQQGGVDAASNAFGVELSKQQGPEAKAWYPASMYNIVRKNGRDVHMVIKPDPECSVNSGLNSIRGGRMAEESYSQVTGTSLHRLTDPLLWRYGALSPTGWDEALSLVADVTRAVVEEQGEDGLFVSVYDHGGAGGGYENTWATGKLYFQSMKIRNIRIHNRPSYNSEVPGTRAMGVAELNNSYEDAELADTILVAGANSLETQTIYFLNHWLPSLRGETVSKKRRAFPDEPVAPTKIIIVDPRRTVTVAACEAEAGKENVLHLQVRPGADLSLFNALLTEINSQGWVDRAFIDAHTHGFDDAIAANHVSVQQAADATGLNPGDIVKAAAWIAQPKGSHRRRTMIAYEKGIIWGNDSFRTNQSIVNLGLATGNVGRQGGGTVRIGGHQEGYVRPPTDWMGKDLPYLDQLIIGGRGGIHQIWGCDHFKTTLNALEFKRVYKQRTDLVKDAMESVPSGDRTALLSAIMEAIGKGGLFSVVVDIVPTQIGSCAHVVLPAATSAEMNLTSMNGERRMRLTERVMDPPGQAKPDCLIAAALAQAIEKSWRAHGKPEIAERFIGYDWSSEEDAFMDGYHLHAEGGNHVTYDRLRSMGTNGFQEPAQDYRDGKIIGTPRLYTDGQFKSADGRATFMKTQARGLSPQGKQKEKETYEFLVNNGRANHIWQSAYLDQQNSFVNSRFPFPYIEMSPSDVDRLGLSAGDLVEIYNENGSTQAVVWPESSVRPQETFMLFAYPPGPVGNIISKATSEFLIPNFKQNWANIRKLSSRPSSVADLTFKSKSYVASA